MWNRRRLAKTLVMLAVFVFFSANTVYFLELPNRGVAATAVKTYDFDFSRVPAGKRPYLNLKSALLVNYSNGEVLYAKNADVQRPIASITKLVTAMVVLDKRIDLSSTATITKEDARWSSKSRLRVGYEMTLLDLLHAALLNSDNRAARALARVAGGTTEEFVRAMNLKMKQLNLRNTVFYEPTGLDSRNVSTATEVAKILHYAYDYELVRQITSQKFRVCRILNRKNRTIRMANTNLLVKSRYKVLSGKTGYIRDSDYCLTTLIENARGERLTCVVLGVPGDNLRFREARRLVDWGFGKVSTPQKASPKARAKG
jgi:D-alanyl-D-alanine endopeptidase (penicillin-binding protein 7)